jgi:hypothetical protein
MKVLAHRVGEDEDDVMILARYLRLVDAREVLEVAAAVMATASMRPRGSSSKKYLPELRSGGSGVVGWKTDSAPPFPLRSRIRSLNPIPNSPRVSQKAPQQTNAI